MDILRRYIHLFFFWSQKLRKTKKQERVEAELDRKPFESKYFFLKYNDSKEFPWELWFKSTLKHHTSLRRKWVAQHEANQLDNLIDEAIC